MAKQEFKFKITLKELSIECEGSRDVGQAFQTEVNRTVGALVNAQRRAMDAAAAPSPQPTLFDNDGLVDPPLNGHNGHTATIPAPLPPTPAAPPPPTTSEKVKRARKSGGETAMSLIRGLMADGFFKEARSVESIRERLRVKGHNNPAGLTSRLQELVKKDELFRHPTDNGFIYKDQPFYDVPATPASPGEFAK